MAKGAPVPLILIRGTEDVVHEVGAELRRTGWVVREGWQLPGDAWELKRLVCIGMVRDSDDARAVLLAAAHGAGLVAGLDAESAVVESLYEDLRRLGSVELRAASGGGDGLPDLDPEQLRILELLNDGSSLDEIAAELSYSRRTVSRRLARLRETLGVSRNAEAVSELARRRDRR